MNLLIDTHVVIWLIQGNENIGQTARNAIEDEGNSLYLSIASLWEISIKLGLGKLKLGMPLDRILEDFIIPGGINILPIEISHLLVLRDLPLHHRDPFDRSIIAQAQFESLILISGDRLFGEYGIDIIW
jgi:PIN domain nuclease of toxin-antitoxin system